ncbi:MAG: NAD(P)-dependent oxidoreductase [Chloroflexia bacterium]|nr:NAD(P)-dependent oxidoreductase [Chloroflexia bacterium]
MRVLVTGGGGRLGAHLTRDLLAHGHAVVNADRRPLPASEAPSEGSDYRYRNTDLGDVGQIAGALTDCDAVIHLGAIPVPYGHADEVVFTQNTKATFAVLQAANLLGVRRAVLASSLATLGMALGPQPAPPRYAPVDEAHPLLPADPYALGKEVDERIGETFHRQTGMSVVAHRFHWVAQPEEAVAAASGTAANPERGARVFWGYVDIRDAATACRLGVEAGGLGFESFVIAAADTLSETPTEELLRQYTPQVELRESILGTASAFSTAKARRLLGFEACHSWRTPSGKTGEAT